MLEYEVKLDDKDGYVYNWAFLNLDVWAFIRIGFINGFHLSSLSLLLLFVTFLKIRKETF